MKRQMQRLRDWIFSLQGKFIITASVCILIFTTIGGILIISREEQLYRQDIVNQGKVIAEISRLMLTNVMVYNELGMMDDRDLRDFLDYFIIDFMKQDKRVKYMTVVNTEGKIIACSDISRSNDISTDNDTLKVLLSQKMSIFLRKFAGGPVLNIVTPLNISSKSWGGVRIVLSTQGIEDTIASLQKEIMLLGLLVLVLSIFIVRVGGKVLAEPVIRLTGTMDSIKDHVDLEQVEAVHRQLSLQIRSDEIGRLQKSFLWMIKRLREADRANKKAMETLKQTEKMVSIGQLASGVAHEINNPLGGIGLCFKNLVEGDMDDETKKEHIEVINDSLARIGNIVDQLLHFSRMTVKEMQHGDINALIDRMLLLLGYHISEKGIVVSTEMDIDMPLLLIDENMICQVLMNIMSNSIQEMNNGGIMTISTERAAGFCLVSIEDTGPGIPEDLLPRIFDPFFTTKSAAKGTGLGLSISKSIIEQHGGEIRVESELNHRTTFFVSLPLPDRHSS